MQNGHLNCYRENDVGKLIKVKESNYNIKNHSIFCRIPKANFKIDHRGATYLDAPVRKILDKNHENA